MLFSAAKVEVKKDEPVKSEPKKEEDEEGTMSEALVRALFPDGMEKEEEQEKDSASSLLPEIAEPSTLWYMSYILEAMAAQRAALGQQLRRLRLHFACSGLWPDKWVWQAIS